jgi:uncharacterized membrane protein
MMTVIGFILFYVGLIVRFTQTSTEDQFTAARYDFLIPRKCVIQYSHEYI